jgi:outer membrane receptor protein involved in Fe transport
MAERFVHTFAAGFEVVPNPTLRPETGWSVELGHTTPVLGAVRLDAAFFWTEARDLIEPQLVVDTTPKIQLQNVTRARIAGVDVTLWSAPIPDHLTASLAYTYLDTRPVLAFRPRHLLTLSADYAPAGTGGAWGLGADFRFASRPERIELEGFVDPRRVAVRVLDLRASWTSGPFDVRLLVANALNYIYNLVPETLAPVRTISVTAAWSY